METGLATRWFVVRTQPMQEKRAEDGLIPICNDVYLPRLPVRKLAGRKMREQFEPMLPGYLFIGLQDGNEPWAEIRMTRGVFSKDAILGNYSAIPAAAVEAVRLVESEETATLKMRAGGLKPGDPVEVILSDRHRHFVESFRATVKDISRLNKRNRARVAAQWFGRLIEVEVNLNQLRPG